VVHRFASFRLIGCSRHGLIRSRLPIPAPTDMAQTNSRVLGNHRYVSVSPWLSLGKDPIRIRHLVLGGFTIWTGVLARSSNANGGVREWD
jgi:hypothetical protein